MEKVHRTAKCCFVWLRRVLGIIHVVLTQCHFPYRFDSRCFQTNFSAVITAQNLYFPFHHDIPFIPILCRHILCTNVTICFILILFNKAVLKRLEASSSTALKFSCQCKKGHGFIGWKPIVNNFRSWHTSHGRWNLLSWIWEFGTERWYTFGSFNVNKAFRSELRRYQSSVPSLVQRPAG